MKFKLILPFIINLKILFAIVAIVLLENNTIAQQRDKKALLVSVYNADSLINSFRSSVYKHIEDPGFRTKCFLSTLTILKIDIDKYGKIIQCVFSDNTDTLFTNEFFKMKSFEVDKLTIERYAKAKGYNECSIFVPINYRPFSNLKRSFDYQNIESLMKFEKKDFNGKAIFISSIEVGVPSENNL